MSDYGVAVLGPLLAAELAAEAPARPAAVHARTPRSWSTTHCTSMTSIDLLVMPHGFTDGLSHHDLYRDEWVCLVSADNADVGDELTIDHLRTMPWVASYHGPTAATPASRQMRMLGIEPRVQVVTENFLTVAALWSPERRGSPCCSADWPTTSRPKSGCGRSPARSTSDRWSRRSGGTPCMTTTRNISICVTFSSGWPPA